MNAEYQRLEAEAGDVQQQMQNLSGKVMPGPVPEKSRFGRELVGLGRRLAALRQGQALIRTVDSAGMRRREREFVAALPKRFHSQRMRRRSVQPGAGVTVALEVRYDHRRKNATVCDAAPGAVPDADAAGDCRWLHTACPQSDGAGGGPAGIVRGSRGMLAEEGSMSRSTGWGR